MKKHLPTLLLLLLLTGCAASPSPASDPSAAASASAPDPDVVTVVSIVDETESGDLLTADALEGFWADERYTYCFPSIKSHYIIVHYSDGTRLPIRDALARGDVTVADLDRFGIGYYREEIVTAVGMEITPGVLDAEGLFWSDERCDYYFPNCDTRVTVLLSDGHSWPLHDALMAGLVSVSDLDRYGIDYIRREK